MPDTILITGGAGFIGSNFVRLALSQNARVVVVDNLTYAGSLLNLKEIMRHPHHKFIKADISNEKAMATLFKKIKPRFVVNFAAETHVDRSIDGPHRFVQTNILGTFSLLEAARHMKHNPYFRFLHVSTDEVYGSLGATGFFYEESPYQPNSPYAATKAGADHLVRAYYETYGLPTLITNCSNNYGPYQFPEKLIPLMILNALEGKNLPIYGDGKNVRDWLFVEDHCQGIWLALHKGKPGEKYNIGGNNEHTNIEIVEAICSELEKIVPAGQNPALISKGIKKYKDLKVFVKDRPGHDRRYAIDARKIRRTLGWKPKFNFNYGMEKTVHWYVSHRSWCNDVQRGNYQRQRLGL